MKSIMKSIYEYIDYRAYLRDYYLYHKKKNEFFSHQLFAQKAGIRSSGFILHVIKGERNLSKPVLLKIARAMELTSAQTEYFEDMVSFDQAKNQSDKEYYFARIKLKRANARIKTLDDRQYEFYSQWYHSIVREMVTHVRNADDINTLARQIIPPITPMQFKKSLILQEELGIVHKRADGSYKLEETFISAGNTTRNMALVNYQKNMLREALMAWDRFKNTEMSMNTVTLSMSDQMLEKVRTEIREFKNRLFVMVAGEQNKAERVFHLNMNLFPVTQTIKGQHDENS